MPANSTETTGTGTMLTAIAMVAIGLAARARGVDEAPVDLGTSRVSVFVGKRGIGHEHAA